MSDSQPPITPDQNRPSEPSVDEVQVKQALENERSELLAQIEDWLELPVQILGFVWLLLLVVELIWGLNPLLNAAVWAIWAIFVFDFGLRLVLAPHKLRFLRSNWLTVLSLVLPALRVLRFARLVRLLRLSRTVRSLRLVKVVGSLNRGMRALRGSFQRRGFGYVALLTMVIALVGAAGMFAFEGRDGHQSPGFANYGESLWWTAMLMTTLGSEFWPRSPEGRVLSFLLALYAFAVFGYVTATLATFFIGREAASHESDVAGEETLRLLQLEIAALRAELRGRAGNGENA